MQHSSGFDGSQEPGGTGVLVLREQSIEQQGIIPSEQSNKSEGEGKSIIFSKFGSQAMQHSSGFDGSQEPGGTAILDDSLHL